MTGTKAVPINVAEVVLKVFLVPGHMETTEKPLNSLVASLANDLQVIAKSFSANLHGVIQTRSIPYHYTHSHVQGLHWQRIHLAELIRARAIETESEREPVALQRAQEKMDLYLREEGLDKIVDDILARLLSLAEEPASLAAAQELTRQGVVLTWSAFEVLARDLFVCLLNEKPALSNQLLATPFNRKRFSAERIDWSTLAGYDFDLSSRIGSYLISKADLTNIASIREIYSALFPDAVDLQKKLADRRLWMLHQKRNTIVHKRGVVDQQYLSSTGDNRAIGSILVVEPKEIELLLDAVLGVGTELTRQVALAL
jgi:hypothetical protein